VIELHLDEFGDESLNLDAGGDDMLLVFVFFEESFSLFYGRF
jgi:hypothetical protein